MADAGIPLSTCSRTLQALLQATHKGSLANAISSSTSPSNITTNKNKDGGSGGFGKLVEAVPWRPPGIVYKKNEVFLDVVEHLALHVHFLASPILFFGSFCFAKIYPFIRFLKVDGEGRVVKHGLKGAIKVRCLLSGMPELRLGLAEKVRFEGLSATLPFSTTSHNSSSSASNSSTKKPTATGSSSKKPSAPTAVPPGGFSEEKAFDPKKEANDAPGGSNNCVDLSDLRFHQCVRLDKFDAERMIWFVPPDGEFELLSYRLERLPKVLQLSKCLQSLFLSLQFHRPQNRCYGSSQN